MIARRWLCTNCLEWVEPDPNLDSRYTTGLVRHHNYRGRPKAVCGPVEERVSGAYSTIGVARQWLQVDCAAPAGSFNRQIADLDLSDPVLTAIVSTVCLWQGVFPRQLLGRDPAMVAHAVAGSLVLPDMVRGTGPDSAPPAVLARRVAWYQVGLRWPALTVSEIGNLVGGHTRYTVGPWVHKLDRFVETYEWPEAMLQEMMADLGACITAMVESNLAVR